MNEQKKTSLIDIILATLVICVVAFPLWVLFFFLVELIFPDIQNGHGTMPLPQAFGAAILTLICCAFLFIKVLGIIQRASK